MSVTDMSNTNFSKLKVAIETYDLSQYNWNKLCLEVIGKAYSSQSDLYSLFTERVKNVRKLDKV